MDIASLGIAMDTSGLRRGEDALNRATQSANRTADAMDKVGASGDKASAGISGTGTAAAGASTSLNRYEQSAQQAGKSMGDLERQSRSFVDSLKDFAIGATAVNAVAQSVRGLVDGLMEIPTAVFSSVRGFAELQAQVDKITVGLKFAAGGDASAGARDLGFLREEATRLGIDLGVASSSFVRLAAAARETTLEGKGARDIFLAVSEAATVMHLSSAEAEGALTAVGQMISKGTVQSEELRGQLGERLPGAFQIAARAMGVTTAELGKMLEQGQVLSDDFLPKFAAQLRKELAGSVEEAANSTQAALGRIDSAWADLKRTVADSGLGQAAAGQLSILTDAMNDVSVSIRRAKSEGAGFWGQFGAGAGSVLSFLNPTNAVNYRAQSLKGMEQQRAQLQSELQDPSLDRFQRGQKGYDLLQLERRLAEARRQVADDQTRNTPNLSDVMGLGVEAARESAAEARARKFLTDGKNLTKAESRDKDLKQIDDDFKAATTGIEKGSDLYNQAVAAAAARKQEVWDKFNKAGKSTSGAVAARQNELGGEIAQLEGMARQREAILKGELADLEMLRNQGLLDERQYIEKSFGAKQTALIDEQVIAEMQADVAAGRKQLAERERYAAKVEEIEERLANSEKERARALSEVFKKLDDARKEVMLNVDAYAASRQRESSRDLASFGMGDNARELNDILSRTEEEFRRQRETLTKRAAKSGLLDTKEYRESLAELDAAMQAQLDRERGYFQQRLDLQTDFQLGTSRALENYRDSAANVAAQTEDMFSRAFSNMEDALVDFAMTGKLNFSDFARSVISDLIRIQTRSALSGIFGQLGGSLLGMAGDATGTSIGGVYGPETQAGLDSLVNSVSTRASGGGAQAGVPLLVGERGRPELFVPDSNGTIIPDNVLARQGAQQAAPMSVEIRNTYHIDSRTDRSEIIAFIDQKSRQTKAEILDSMNRGGAFSPKR
ncbi:phage tail tape measure protein [Cupriavidus taiwanensis]|uniref:phage tail tape measure protein n=1 Tax=Cupriavidus taiwanensis TaxID=164546 RepID=UPI00157213EB|nr:phage tail tape measure protein [Cupriavidus taiwanensis]NSX15977.1 phage tail tape measure protein [Cupriavidus taiwanensis]